MLDRISEIVSHICIVLAVPIIAFYILDIFNPQMNFLTNDFSLLLVAFYALITLVNSIYIIVSKNKRKR